MWVCVCVLCESKHIKSMCGMKDGVLMNKTCNNVFFTEMKQYAESNLELSTHTYCIAYPRHEKA